VSLISRFAGCVAPHFTTGHRGLTEIVEKYRSVHGFPGMAQQGASTEADMNRTAILKSISACAALAVPLASPADAMTAPISLRVRIDNVDTSGGPVRVAMFDREHWLSDTVVAATEITPTQASVFVRLSAPRPGRYGLAAYQDTNRDGRLNRNIVGLPTEPVPFSNDASILLGPPGFEAAAVEVGAGGAETAVRLN